ncbi:DUF799 domain-containing protein [Litoribrevibacter albus]|uniref:Lipoprotein n=1 Tax=Litoribrevibacter albus TaxID=1473156 RepID=A0AA37S7I1_9GAMM|nr:GNA1162 family protein [Litoribrevibacter albus]GLQ30585.1 putative lipoprotein [Litoribrevibacter albus]
MTNLYHTKCASLLKALIISLTVLATGCAVQQPYDYTALRASNPKSILVIPPANQTVEVSAPYIFLSTITFPLAERGYYVYPVAVVDQLLKDNGLPTPAEMNSIPLDKIDEIINPDAVLYITIDNWGQSYQLIQSVATVSSSWKLVDTKTGQTLWEGKAYAQQKSGDGGGGIIGMLVAAAVEQVASAMDDKTPRLSRFANSAAVYNSHNGLLPGPYAPKPEPKESATPQ